MKINMIFRIVFITLVLGIIFSIGYSSEATFNPGKYYPGTVSKPEAEAVFTIGEKAFGVLKNLATVIAVVTIGIIGLRYMFGSVDQKAEYKSTMMPWFIGAIMVVMITTIIDIIQRFASKI